MGVAAFALLSFVLMGLAGLFAYKLVSANAWVSHTTGVLSEIRAMHQQLSAPQTTPSGSAEGSVNQPTLLDRLNDMAGLTTDNPQQQEHIQKFRALLASAASAQNQPNGQQLASILHAEHVLLNQMEDEEIGLLTLRSEAQMHATRLAALFFSVLCVLLVVLGGLTSLAAWTEFRLRAATERVLEDEKRALQVQSRELALMTAGSRFIQSARDEAQAYEAAVQILQKLLPGVSGFLGLLSPSRDLIEAVAHWGAGKPPAAFPPSDCLALQQDQLVHSSRSLLKIKCQHGHESGDTVCIPLQSASGHVGILHLSSATPLDERRVEAASVFATHLSLGLSNLRLREVLKNQSVRDPLTGLFNRRYFDETLEREIATSKRTGQPFSVLMLDIDHFKRYNDTHGHSAGDEVLRGFARLLRAGFRENDVLCRYGGEEFAAILTGSALHPAYTRAEAFRRMIEQSELRSTLPTLGQVTASLGIACSDEFRSAAELVQAADAALYHAKHMGRNTTWVYSEQTEGLPAITKAQAWERPQPAASGKPD